MASSGRTRGRVSVAERTAYPRATPCAKGAAASNIAGNGHGKAEPCADGLRQGNGLAPTLDRLLRLGAADGLLTRLGEQTKVNRSLAGLAAALQDLAIPIWAFAVTTLAILLFATIVMNSAVVAGEVTVDSYFIRPELNDWEQLLFGAWQHWDGLWYLKIAAQGYDFWDYSLAFYPLYPTTVRLVGSLIDVDYVATGVLISIGFFLVGLIYLFKLARLELGRDGAVRSVLYLCIFPTSFFFLAVYTESMFLAASAAVFYYARKGNWLLAAALGLLAALTRSTGLLLLLPLAIEYMQQKNWNWRRIQLDFFSLALVPAGTGLYALYNQIAFRDPLGFIHAQEHWLRDFAWPWQTLKLAWDFALNEPNVPLVTDPDGTLIYDALHLSNLISMNAFNLAFLVIGLALTVLAFKTLRPAYAVYALLVLAIPLFSPSGEGPLLSLPRFCVTLFPIIFVLAQLGKNRFVNVALWTLMLTGLGFFLLRYAAWYWVA